MDCSRFAEDRRRMVAIVASDPTNSSVSLKSLLNPKENQAKTVKAVLDFIAATGLPIEKEQWTDCKGCSPDQWEAAMCRKASSLPETHKKKKKKKKRFLLP